MILVTGGTGFIGSHLVRRLVEQGEHVRVLTRDAKKVLSDQTVAICSGDLRDEASLSRAMAGVNVVYHMAGYGSPSTAEDGFRQIVDVNIAGTLSLLTAANKAAVRRVIFASSASVYGDSPESPKREAMAVAPQTPYAISKVSGEHLCDILGRRYGIETVVLRYFNVYGPGQPALFVIPRFIDMLRKEERVRLHGGGEQVRDFIYIDDVVTATMQAGTVQRSAGQIINVGSGVPITIKHVMTELAALLGRTPKIDTVAALPGDIRESIADITVARETLGYEPAFSFREGLRRSVGPVAISALAREVVNAE